MKTVLIIIFGAKTWGVLEYNSKFKIDCVLAVFNFIVSTL